ncbi:MAG TPA: Crp/Fnr family transcriptional regulator, partial [Alistipes sp.]|nr:Crp/Fnr family transcriptional regulator [Alistipes sp.]
GGRSWYTALGHDSQNYDDPQYRAQVLGALRWVVAGPAPEKQP